MTSGPSCWHPTDAEVRPKSPGYPDDLVVSTDTMTLARWHTREIEWPPCPTVRSDPRHWFPRTGQDVTDVEPAGVHTVDDLNRTIDQHLRRRTRRVHCGTQVFPCNRAAMIGAVVGSLAIPLSNADAHRSGFVRASSALVRIGDSA